MNSYWYCRIIIIIIISFIIIIFLVVSYLYNRYVVACGSKATPSINSWQVSWES